MRLAGIEAAEVATSATSTATSTPSESTAASTKPTSASAETTASESSPAKSTPASGTAEQATGAGNVLSRICRAVGLNRISDLVEVYTGHWAHLPRLAADGNRIRTEVGVGGCLRQFRSADAG